MQTKTKHRALQPPDPDHQVHQEVLAVKAVQEPLAVREVQEPLEVREVQEALGAPPALAPTLHQINRLDFGPSIDLILTIAMEMEIFKKM